jgi:hypothetical protein
MELHHTAVKEETGFSSVEILLSLIIIVLITFTGYYIYHTQKTTDAINKNISTAASATLPKSTKKPSSIATTTEKTDYLTITELGIKLAVTGDTEPTYAFHPSGSMSGDGSFSYARDTVDVSSKQYNNLKNSDGNLCGSIDDNTGKVVSAPNTRRMIQITRSPATTETSATSEGSVTIGSSKYTYFKASHYRPGCSQLTNGKSDQSIFTQDAVITDQLIRDAATLVMAKS